MVWHNLQAACNLIISNTGEDNDLVQSASYLQPRIVRICNEIMLETFAIEINTTKFSRWSKKNLHIYMINENEEAL